MTKVTLAQNFFRQPAREGFTFVMRGDCRQHVALQLSKNFRTDQYSLSVDDCAVNQSLFGCGFDNFVAPTRARSQVRAVQPMSFRASNKFGKLLRAIAFRQIPESCANPTQVSPAMLRRRRIEHGSATKSKLRRI